MTALDSSVQFGGAFGNVLLRLFMVFTAIPSWIAFLFSYAFAITGLVIVTAGFWFVAQNSNVVIENGEQFMRCSVFPIYEEYVRPLISGIFRRFWNFTICWWNAVMWYPYGFGRSVAYPIFRDCDLITALSRLLVFLDRLFLDVVLDYIASGAFLVDPLDLTQVCAAWMSFWEAYQAVLCCGCNDLCPLLKAQAFIVGLPPMFFINPFGLLGSSQLGEQCLWDALSDFVNGSMVVIQDTLFILRDIVYPTTEALPRPDYRRAVDYYCSSLEAYFCSMENVLQRFTDDFLPFDFVWQDVLKPIPKVMCIVLRLLHWAIKVFVLNFDQAVRNFETSPYWRDVAKEDFKEIVNLYAPPTNFEPITVPVPGGTQITISSYYLGTDQLLKPDGVSLNPLFGKQRVSDCTRMSLERIFCDPLNEGVTCQQRWNGTLLEMLDFGCVSEQGSSVLVDIATGLFEITCHIVDPNGLFIYLDKQPFTKLAKQSSIQLVECFVQVFLVVEDYGFCIGRLVVELYGFWICSVELVFRIAVAIVTLPYFKAYMPGTCNFITCPGDEALNEALEFLDRLVAETPDSLINCLTFLMNTALAVPFAGCPENPSCSPVGFVPPPMRKFDPDTYGGYGWETVPQHMVLKGHFLKRLSPVRHYENGSVSWSPFMIWDRIKSPGFTSAFVYASNNIDQKLNAFVKDWDATKKCGDGQQRARAEWHVPGTCPVPNEQWNLFPEQKVVDRLVMATPTPELDCAECFDFACLPRSLIVWAAQLLSFLARALNALIQADGGIGSDYFTGVACNSPGGMCLASDLVQLTANTVAPLGCICQYVKLLVPTQRLPDPCCFFILLGEAMGCLAQIVINVANSIAGDPDFLYLKAASNEPGLLQDVGVILELLVALFDCACNFLRLIVGVVFQALPLGQQDLIKNADPCCVPIKFFSAAMEVIRWAFQIAVAFSQLETLEGACYFYNRPECGPTATLNNLPILVQFDVVRSKLITPASAIPPTCDAQRPVGADQPNEGIATCVCTLVNAILSQVYEPDPLTGINRCPIDLCCPIYRAGNFLDEAIFFVSRMVAGLWQDWAVRSTFAGDFLLPIGFIDTFFCDEYGPMNPNFSFNPIANPNAVYGDSDLECLKFEPVIVAFDNLVSGCLCNPSLRNALFDVADKFLLWFTSFVTEGDSNPFPIRVIWPNCFCQGGPDGSGILPPFVTILTVLGRQIMITLRNINNPNFWAPAGGSFTVTGGSTASGNNGLNSAPANPPLEDSIKEFRKSWVNRLLAPIADSLCAFITNAGCLISMLLGDSCAAQGLQDGRETQARWQLLSSLSRYLLEAIIRAIALIEAFAKIVGAQLPGQCVGDPGETSPDSNEPGICKPGGSIDLNYGNTVGGINSDKLGAILVSLLTFIIDALIGVGRFGCTELCNSDSETTTAFGFSTAGFDPPDPCACWNYSPYYSPRLTVCDLSTGNGQFAEALNLCDSYGNLTGTDGSNPGFERSRQGGCGWSTGSGSRYCVNEFFPGGLSRALLKTECGYSESFVAANYPNGVPFQLTGPQNFVTLGGQFRRWSFCSLRPVRNGTGAIDGSCTDKIRSKAQDLLPQYEKDSNIVFACYRFVPQQFHGYSTAQPNFDSIESGGGELYSVPGLRPCTELGMCKNDQNVRCTNFGLGSRTFVLDGIFRAALIYLKCVLNDLFRIALPIGFIPGAPPGVNSIVPTIQLGKVVDPFLFFLSIIWQLSGGIIKFLVAIFILLLNFITKSPWSAFFTALGQTFGLLNLFIQIFTQPLILSARNVPGEKDPRYDIYHHTTESQKERELLFTMWDYVFQGAENVTEALGGGQPLIDCFCKYLDLAPDCSFNMTLGCAEPTGLTTTDVLMYVAGRFPGTSVCDKLVQSCSGMSWDQVPEPEKYTYLQCVAGKVKGQRIKTMLGNSFPDDFFISETGWMKYFENIAANAKRYVQREEIKRTTENIRHQKRSQEDWSDTFQLLPEEYQKEMEKREAQGKVLLVNDGVVRKDSPMLEPITKLIGIEFKYKTGYYHFLGRRAWDNIKAGRFIENVVPSYSASFHLMKSALDDFRQNWNYTAGAAADFYTSSYDLAKHTIKATEELFVNGFQNVESPAIKRKRETPVPKAIHPVDFIKQMPIVKHWQKANDTIPLKRVVKRVVEKKRQLSTYVGDELDKVSTRLTSLSWHSSNWDWRRAEESIERVRRILLRPFYWIWPHHLTEEQHQRFVLSGDGCKIIDGAVELAAERVDYCLNSYMFNIPDRHKGKVRSLEEYVKHSSAKRGQTYLSLNRHRIEWQKSPGAENDTDAYLRPRLQIEEKKDRFDGVDHRIKKRVLHHERIAAGTTGFSTPFNTKTLYERVICFIEDLFGIDLTSGANDLFDKITEWFENDQTDYSFYPDVGAKFWFQFFFRCENPENTSCSIGIGLEEALKKVSLVFVVIVLVGVFVFPGMLALIGGGLSLFIIYWIAVAVVAFHWSPFCLFMTPSFPLRPGLVLPIIPFPISTMVFPECLWDQILAVTDKYITNCYDGIGIIKGSIVNGDVCPVCPEKISVPNCCSVGVCDGVGNLIYAANRWGSSKLANFFVGISETNLIRLLPGTSNYFRILFDEAQNNDPDIQDQQELCFYLTIGSISLPLLILFFAASFLLFVLPALVDLFVAILGLITTNPLWEAAINGGEAQGFFEIPGDQSMPDLPTEDDLEEEDDQEPTFDADTIEQRIQSRQGAGFVDQLTSKVARLFMPSKEKSE